MKYGDTGSRDGCSSQFFFRRVIFQNTEQSVFTMNFGVAKNIGKFCCPTDWKCTMTQAHHPLEQLLRNRFSEFRFEVTEDSDKGTLRIGAVKDARSGFDVDAKLSNKTADISFSSKTRMMVNLAMLGLTSLLTYLFGGAMLAAFGMVGDVGGNTVTLKLLYAIPIFIFLIPSLIIGAIIAKAINPPARDLIQKVKDCVVEARYTVTED